MTSTSTWLISISISMTNSMTSSKRFKFIYMVEMKPQCCLVSTSKSYFVIVWLHCTVWLHWTFHWLLARMSSGSLCYSTTRWGAEKRTATVVIIVNVVKVIRQNLQNISVFQLKKTVLCRNKLYLSMTIAANFQSATISSSSSFTFNLLVMNLISLRMDWSSLTLEVEHGVARRLVELE